MRPEQDRVKKLLTEAVTLLCRNSLQFDDEVMVEGLLGITLDKRDIFLVSINETIRQTLREAVKRPHTDQVNRDTKRPDSPSAKLKRRKRQSHEKLHQPSPPKVIHTKQEPDELLPDAEYSANVAIEVKRESQDHDDSISEQTITASASSYSTSELPNIDTQSETVSVHQTTDGQSHHQNRDTYNGKNNDIEQSAESSTMMENRDTLGSFSPPVRVKKEEEETEECFVIDSDDDDLSDNSRSQFSLAESQLIPTQWAEPDVGSQSGFNFDPDMMAAAQHLQKNPDNQGWDPQFDLSQHTDSSDNSSMMFLPSDVSSPAQSSGMVLPSSSQKALEDPNLRLPKLEDLVKRENEDPPEKVTVSKASTCFLSQMRDDPDAFVSFSDLPNVYFQKTEKSVIGKLGQIKKSNRVFKTKNACKFCGEVKTKYIKHLEARHADTEQMKELKNITDNVNLSKDEKKRKRLDILATIKNEGNKKHNDQVLQEKQGLLLIARAPSGHGPFIAAKYNPCPSCLMYVQNLPQHRNNTDRCRFGKKKMSKRQALFASRAIKVEDGAAD